MTCYLGVTFGKISLPPITGRGLRTISRREGLSQITVSKPSAPKEEASVRGVFAGSNYGHPRTSRDVLGRS